MMGRQLPQEMLYLLLLEDAEHPTCDAGVYVHILAGEKSIDQSFHLLIAQHLSVRYRCMTGKRKSQCLVDLVDGKNTFLHRTGYISWPVFLPDSFLPARQVRS